MIKSSGLRVLKTIVLVAICCAFMGYCRESGNPGQKASFQSSSQTERGDGKFAIMAVDAGEIGWGKNTIRAKVRNLTSDAQKLLVRVNVSYLNSGRFYPIEDSRTLDFEPLQEKEILRDFYVIPDHGTLEIRCLMTSISKLGLYETVFYEKFRTEFNAPNYQIHSLGFYEPMYPAFETGESEHFVFYYFPQIDQAGDISNITGEWEKSYNDLSEEAGTELPGKIRLFILPDAVSAKSVMLFEGRRLFYHDTLLLIGAQDDSPVRTLSAFSRVFPLLANRTGDFYLGTGGYGFNGITNHEIRFKVLLCLYQGMSIEAISESLDLPEREIIEAADELVNISNARKEGDIYKPDILILTRDEARRIQAKADRSARDVADLIERNRKKVEAMYERLSFSNIFPFSKIGFHLIGSLLLEGGMIDFFFRDRTILLPYPRRPRKNDPEGAGLRYYCWMIEGREIQDDFYGFNDRGYLDKPQIVSYGRYFINLPRKYFDRTVSRLIEVTGGKDRFVKDFLPEYQKQLGNLQYRSPLPEIDGALQEFSYRLPVYNEKDFEVVKSLISELGPKILDYFKKARIDLDQAFEQLKGSDFSSFSEFFYTYYHLVFAGVADELAERGFFALPNYRFASWMQERPVLEVKDWE